MFFSGSLFAAWGVDKPADLLGQRIGTIGVNDVEPSAQFRQSARMLASIAVVVAALYLAKDILVPLTLAVLLSFLLSPVCDRLERGGLGRIPAVLVTAIVGFSILGAGIWTAVVQMTELAPQIPEYQQNLQAKFQSTGAYLSTVLSQATKTAHDMGDDLSPAVPAEPPQGTDEQPYFVRVLSSPGTPLESFGGTFGAMLGVLGSAGIVIVLVVFFLVRRDDLRDRFIRLVGQGDVTLTTQMLEDAATRVSGYLLMQFLINATFGIAVGSGLFFIGVPNAILWGILAATLRFIPYIGPWIAAAMPIGLSLAISEGWTAPICTVVLFVVLELFSNNVMEPWLYGKNTGISPVAVLLAAVFWTWLWGPFGLLLATPLTVCLLVIGKHVPQLSFLDILLGDEPVFDPNKRIYQRLLAGDQEEATELLDGYLEAMPLVDVYDKVLIPALAVAQVHWHRGELDESRHQFIVESLKEMVLQQGDAPSEDQAAAPRQGQAKCCILCLPARDEADEMAAVMLAQLIELSGPAVQAVSIPVQQRNVDLSAPWADCIQQHQPAVVCISAMAPAAVAHARSLGRRLRRRFADVNLVVGLWNAHCDLTKAKARIGGGDRTYIVATLAEAQERVRLLSQPRLPPDLEPSLPNVAIAVTSGSATQEKYAS
jgi:predicted PurR-regulated permease PerM